MIDLIKKQLYIFETKYKKDKEHLYSLGRDIYQDGCCQVLTHSTNYWEVLVIDQEETEREIRINFTSDEIYPSSKNKDRGWDAFSIAALLEIERELLQSTPKPPVTGKIYTKEGMSKRVLAERQEKSDKSSYKIKFADNIYGEHTLTNEKGIKYAVTLRNFENETGYIDNPDLKTNKLGTTKHIMYAFEALKSKPKIFNKLSKSYPFIEIYLDPQNDYRITWFYPHAMPAKTQTFIKKHFGAKHFLPDSMTKKFLTFIRDAHQFPKIKIRPEVEEKVRLVWDKDVLEQIRQKSKLDFSLMKAKLFPYQKAGVHFATFQDGAILADEMGLGKTIQAIATGVMKKHLFGFSKCLVVCPASLKEQWKREIEKFSNEDAVIVDGLPLERREIYRDNKAYFVIINYETVLRDLLEINQMNTDFIILDEAQRIKNFSTVTAQNVKKLQKKHALVITGTPIENRLSDLYSIMEFVQPGFLAPLWEFSYQHCLFDESKKDKITGYYNLQQLKDRISKHLLRREKSKVLKDLPNVTEINVPIKLHPVQMDYHTNYAHAMAKILHKKFISAFDLQRLMLLMASMRMVCDCSYLVDKETFHSPKLAELEHILVEKMDILHTTDRKIIIFSEWTHMLNIIGKMLVRNGIGYAMLSGKVAVKHRGQLVRKFETDPNCKIFLSTEAGGSGLNLQMADTVINFELPWNPAKKNQRIGRIDRLGQMKKQLTVINFVSQQSIEIKIASGLNLKQNLFDGVLSTDKGPDMVDFSTSGKAQFLAELEAMMVELSQPQPTDITELPEEDTEIGLVIDREGTLQEVITDEADNGSELMEADNANPPTQITEAKAPQAALENVLNSGMEFLSGLLQMATGQNIGLENKKVEIDKTTGEVVMRFKLPKF